ncbi:hypothetical protein CIG1485E_0123 [Campylobacter iguaniorum]|uniref:Uncharacterized protein n=1 Tax=Campylobacter iguaniorum TaxID=1244531 RepID=A0A076F7I2_9BACT|nr:hypothetical protein [Campylobacter iguaniorum]AII14001.1 hypothetical protein CIG1485E_0123 [Campylobacter iguaniorum]
MGYQYSNILLEESLLILEKYRNEITTEQYQQNRSIIYNYALDGRYMDEEGVVVLIEIDKKSKMTTWNDLIAKYKKAVIDSDCKAY